MPSMTAYSFGDVVLVQFLFADQLSTKPWPATVISSECYNTERPDVIIMPVTSRIREALGYAQHLLTDWSVAGLLKPSVIKPLIATAEKSLVRRVLGQLGRVISNQLIAGSRKLLGMIQAREGSPGRVGAVREWPVG